MKSNKILYIKELCMNLPDDFEGNTLDALKLLVTYREEAEWSKTVDITKKDKAQDNLTSLWTDNDKKCYMDRVFMEFNSEINEWVCKDDLTK